jgi:hypothetical protein
MCRAFWNTAPWPVRLRTTPASCAQHLGVPRLILHRAPAPRVPGWWVAPAFPRGADQRLQCPFRALGAEARRGPIAERPLVMRGFGPAAGCMSFGGPWAPIEWLDFLARTGHGKASTASIDRLLFLTGRVVLPRMLQFSPQASYIIYHTKLVQTQFDTSQTRYTLSAMSQLVWFHSLRQTSDGHDGLMPGNGITWSLGNLLY